MDVHCQTCGEPWEDFYLTHEIGLEHLEEEGFTVEPLPGIPEDEMIEGHLLLRCCPDCKRRDRVR